VSSHLIPHDEKDINLSIKKAKDSKKSRAYAWAAFMWQRHPDEMKKLLKYGTPSDELIFLADQKFEYTVRGKRKFRSFPESLHKSTGQKLLFNAVAHVAEFKKEIPVLAYITYREIAAQVKLRRNDATTNMHMVAEAVFYRAAVEFKSEVLFSFDSINAWITAKYNKTLGYHTIRKALELLEAKFYIHVREWGVKGNRRRCTKIGLNFTKDTCASFLLDSDKWIFEGFAAFKAVESRETTARQNVLEVHIQNYLNRDQDSSKGPVWAPVPKLFPKADAKITEQVEEIIDGVWTDDYLDRLLGELVPAVCENEPNYRQDRARLPGYSTSD
jgi:hypothetical protein